MYYLDEAIANPESSMLFVDYTNMSPALLGAVEMIQDERMKAFTLAGVDGQPIPYNVEMGLVWELAQGAIEAVYEGADPEDAYRAAAEEVREQIGD